MFFNKTGNNLFVFLKSQSSVLDPTENLQGMVSRKISDRIKYIFFSNYPQIRGN